MSKILLISTLVCFLVSSPLMPSPVGTYPLISYGLPMVPPQAKTVNEFIDLVPKDASILVQNNLFPLVSDRSTAFVTPASVFFPSNTSFHTVLKEILNKMDYILLDMNTNILDTGLILSNELIKKEYGLLGFANGVFLLKKGYAGEPLVCEKIFKIYNYENLTILEGVNVEKDSLSKSQHVISVSGYNKNFWYGPYVYLPPGKYQATYRIKVAEKSTDKMLTLGVFSFATAINGKISGNNQTGYHINFSIEGTGQKTEHNITQVYGDSFTPNKYQEIVIEFEVNSLEPFEFAGLDVSTTNRIYLDQIRIDQIQANYTYSTLIEIT